MKIYQSTIAIAGDMTSSLINCMASLSNGSLRFGAASIPFSHVFFFGRHSFGLVNLRPVVPGHVLIVPYRPSAVRLTDLTSAELSDIWTSASTVSRMLESYFNCSSTSFVVQDGEAAGRTVPHLHIHVLPRRNGDFLDNDEVYRRLQSHDSENTVKPREPEVMRQEADALRKMVASSEAEIRKDVEREVVERMSKFEDASHDARHVWRVRALALEIARQESKRSGTEVDFWAVELAAMLHDLQDHKYVDVKEMSEGIVREILLYRHQCDWQLVNRVEQIVEHVSYSKEKKLREEGKWKDLGIDLACVQDADRLDAIGAVGIARCFTFGGSRGRSLEEGIDHFHEKLLLVKDLMKTETGKMMAIERHRIIQQFVDQFQHETNV